MNESGSNRGHSKRSWKPLTLIAGAALLLLALASEVGETATVRMMSAATSYVIHRGWI